jgi:hypothetical protein
MKDTIRELTVPKQNQVVIAILAGLAVIAGAIFYLNMGASPDNAMSDAEMDAAELAAPLVASSDGDPLATPNPLGELTLGDPAAPITIVEYSSLTCPHCAAFHTETLPALKEKYVDTGQVLVKFRPFPLDPYAMAGPCSRNACRRLRVWRLSTFCSRAKACGLPRKTRPPNCRKLPNKPVCRKTTILSA